MTPDTQAMIKGLEAMARAAWRNRKARVERSSAYQDKVATARTLFSGMRKPTKMPNGRMLSSPKAVRMTAMPI